ncbi:MAG: DUF4347 domain-containing protein [Pirellulaceae bacterium]
MQNSHSSIRRRRFSGRTSRNIWRTSRLEDRTMLAADTAEVGEMPAAEISAAEVSESVDAASSSIHAATSLMLVDDQLADVDQLLQGVDSDCEVVLLSAEQDFVDQVTQILAARRGVQQLHIVTHGSEGQIHLGQQVIDQAALDAASDQIRQWIPALTVDADILLYGCETGKGTAGFHFANKLAHLTNADVAASTNITGSLVNSDWHLELAVGHVEFVSPFSKFVRSEYQHTLDVVVNAWGSTGEEELALLIDGVEVQRWTVNATWQPFVYATNETIAGSQVAVRFTNDVYQPENNYDRNLTVDNVIVNGVLLQSEDSRTYSTGTWLPGDGIVAGYGRGETLHANGEFQYFGESVSQIEFAGHTWTNNDPSQDVAYVQNNQLILSGEQASVWTKVDDVQVGDTYVLEFDRSSSILNPGNGERTPYSDIGVDFYGIFGTRIGGTSGVSSTVSREIEIPRGTDFVVLWMWNEGAVGSRTLEMQVNSFSFEKLDLSADTSPPSAELMSTSLNVDDGGTSASFVVRYTDDFHLDQNGTLRITGPNGFDQTAVTFTGVGGDYVTEAQLLHGIFPPSNSSFATGEYTVTLEPNSLIDLAGNVAPGRVLGTLLLF